jgi:hypothetical protein
MIIGILTLLSAILYKAFNADGAAPTPQLRKRRPARRFFK